MILNENIQEAIHYNLGFPGGLESACNARDPGSIPGLGRAPGEENGNPLQYSCLENPMDGRVWQATVLGVAKSQTQLSDFILILFFKNIDITTDKKRLRTFLILEDTNEMITCNAIPWTGGIETL